MSIILGLRRFFASFFLPLRIPAPPDQDLSSRIIKFTGDGAWCWFQDPRAIYVSGQKQRTYAGWVTKDGKIQVGAYDHNNGQIEIVTIKKEWEIDDHNNNTFLVLPDKRIMIFYTQHDKVGLFSRTTLNPESIGEWTEEITVANTPRITYSHPVYLSEEKRIYVFWRGESWKPTFSTSTDGIVWTVPQILLQDKGREHQEVRPYIKIASDGKREIHFAFTDGHPMVEPENSVYYFKYKDGKFSKASGALIGTLDDLPIQHCQSDVVFDGKLSKVRGWIWDIAMDIKGNPVIAYTRLPQKWDHRYHYGYWNGNKWLDNEITAGGVWFPKTTLFSREREPYYSGGIVIDHNNPSIVYVSRKIKKYFEIEKWATADQGESWISTTITSNSKYNNVRPVVPMGLKSNMSYVLWMEGDYIHYTKYNTGISMFMPHHDS